MITQQFLKSIIAYNKNEGTFFWKKKLSNHCNTKVEAGYIHKTGYRRIVINNKQYQAHRLAWLYIYGEFPLYDIDHINRIRHDNRIKNLRPCSQQQNSFNTDLPKHNTSKYKGVTFNKTAKKWQAQAGLNGKVYYLGTYKDIKEASNAYENFCIKNHKDFYRVLPR